ncbi:ATP-binding protein [Wohlfahrtiimonas chitiniclastica]|uniref:ATP-binding protein n=1 Tax=Wohlfahrtiimonas chitiniclastica TaxID=400946 RepID=UPI001BCDD0F9|nr:ATP-binding protein [Wohlfahrtiimonas chitiniclastica]MBS7829223.1 ATP-binding protein [Wohlfahrtiimonas chitiniclastica]MBS7836461.1 ATP-binding protein [Wohlfahrtiimonas chitiniclastica]
MNISGLSIFKRYETMAKATEDPSVSISLDQFEVCEKHGKYQSYKDIGNGREVCINPSCPICRAEARAKEIIGKAGIQKRFLNCSFENYQASNDQQAFIKSKIQSFADNFPKVLEVGSSLILSGSVGTGKTHLSCAVANQLALSGYTSCLRTVSELVQSIRDGRSWSSDKTASQLIDEYTAFDLLIIDEFGVQSGTDNELNILFDVVNARYADQKPTMALTNLSKDEFKQTVGDRIFDRLTHKGVFLKLEWESYRSKEIF